MATQPDHDDAGQRRWTLVLIACITISDPAILHDPDVPGLKALEAGAARIKVE